MYKSCAEWPRNVYTNENENSVHVSTAKHSCIEEAYNYCCVLIIAGFGGMGTIFPVKTWIEEDGETDEKV
jgi:hypothetical protein